MFTVTRVVDDNPWIRLAVLAILGQTFDSFTVHVCRAAWVTALSEVAVRTDRRVLRHRRRWVKAR